MNPMCSLGVRHLRRTVLASCFVTLLISLKPISTSAQEVCDFDSLASDVAHAIERASNESHTVVLVTDFSARSEPDSQVLRLWIVPMSSPPSPATNCPREFFTAQKSLPAMHRNCRQQQSSAARSSIRLAKSSFVCMCRRSKVRKEFRQGDHSRSDADNGRADGPKVAASFGEDKTVWAKAEESGLKASPPSSGPRAIHFRYVCIAPRRSILIPQ
jgi:hypothetical protein